MVRRIWAILVFCCIFLVLAAIGSVNYLVVKTTNGQLYSSTDAIPKKKVGLLLGTAKYKDKARKIINPFYQNRIDATVALYMAGKVDFVIVSGDNGTAYYNEPAMMKEDLIARGVPANHIFMDNAGFRTLDSILRCRDIFGENNITIISQKFHNERALFIANHKKVKAVAFNAADAESYTNPIIRERFARVKMALDLLLNTQAKYYGERVEIK